MTKRVKLGLNWEEAEGEEDEQKMFFDLILEEFVRLICKTNQTHQDNV
jgi:hypothetical protein